MLHTHNADTFCVPIADIFYVRNADTFCIHIADIFCTRNDVALMYSRPVLAKDGIFFIKACRLSTSQLVNCNTSAWFVNHIVGRRQETQRL